MFNEENKKEILDHLERAGNPIFYYDNDADGLCAFLLLRRYLDKGYGVAVRSYPELDEGYAKRAEELGGDYVFVLDKPDLSEGFLKALEEQGLPVVWIDHHHSEDDEKWKEFHNNLFSYKGDVPTTALVYDLLGKPKDDGWLAGIGCVSDHYIPDFLDSVKEKWPELLASEKMEKPFDILYGTRLGEIARALNFGLKDSITNVVKMQKYLCKVNSPEEVLEENLNNEELRIKYESLKGIYEKLMEKALENVSENLLFFEYSGSTSMSADLSNGLCYKFPEKVIAVAFKKV
jgi:hypothetical protein